eukprot:scaffold1027_cov108-Cylindrotheca_fusiformis.AAC.2
MKETCGSRDNIVIDHDDDDDVYEEHTLSADGEEFEEITVSSDDLSYEEEVVMVVNSESSNEDTKSFATSSSSSVNKEVPTVSFQMKNLKSLSTISEASNESASLELELVVPPTTLQSEVSGLSCLHGLFPGNLDDEKKRSTTTIITSSSEGTKLSPTKQKMPSASDASTASGLSGLMSSEGMDESSDIISLEPSPTPSQQSHHATIRRRHALSSETISNKRNSNRQDSFELRLQPMQRQMSGLTACTTTMMSADQTVRTQIQNMNHHHHHGPSASTTTDDSAAAAPAPQRDRQHSVLSQPARKRMERQQSFFELRLRPMERCGEYDGRKG